MSLPALDAFGWLTRLLVALGPLVIVPLGLAITLRDQDSTLARVVRRLALPSAFGFAVALTQPSGVLAATLTMPWVITCGLVGLLGLARFLGRAAPSRFDLSELAIDIGFAYLPVGGVWALVNRSDLVILGFTGTAALLTAAHFHFAGFGACVLIGTLGKTLGDRRDTGDRIATLLTVASVAILAIGITVSRALEVAAAWTLVLGVVLTARLLWRVSATEHGASRGLARASAVASVVAAGFAAHFATVGFAALDGAALRRMLLGHATLNALGFVGAGLLSRRLARPSTR